MNMPPLSAAQTALLSDFHDGKRVALARIISIVENERPGFAAILSELHGSLGRAQRIGITGPPGAGKSTLTGALAAAYRERGETVAIVAVDPSSPFTGGALLGDRIRMSEISTDPGIFIRSMAARGSLGGLAVTTREVVDVLDAFGFDRILIETVGVGQSELDIAAAADTTVVVLVPEAGDSIQAMKAGLMEISDLFVINKADRPGADKLAREVELMLRLRSGDAMHRIPAHHGVDLSRVRERRAGATAERRAAASAERLPAELNGEVRTTRPAPDTATWSRAVLQTIAETGEGVAELQGLLDRHKSWLEASGEGLRRREARNAQRVREAVERQLKQIVWHEQGGEERLQEALPDLSAGRASPYEVAARIVRGIKD
jgi:LAO/AO transport system kinase